MTIDQKNKKISASLKSTKNKRKNQECKVFEVKVDKSHLSKVGLEQINRLFLEAKWFFNYVLTQKDVFKVNDKIKKVEVKVKDKFEERELKLLGSQIKQSILSELCNNIKALATIKKKGGKVGKIKFKSRCTSINLKQFGNTYRIKGNRIKIQGITQWIKVRGLDQLKGYEIANAKFIHKAGDYYFHITCYKDKSNNKKLQSKSKAKQIALDFGIKTS